jgi:hypothetical protein
MTGRISSWNVTQTILSPSMPGTISTRETNLWKTAEDGARTRHLWRYSRVRYLGVSTMPFQASIIRPCTFDNSVVICISHPLSTTHSQLSCVGFEPVPCRLVSVICCFIYFV